MTPAVSMVSSVMQTAQVSDGGPNHGLWYMTAGFASADIRSQVKSYWRADHPGLPLSGTVAGGCQNAYGNTNNRNVFAVNTTCMGNSSTYNAWLNGLWTHEDRHRNVAVPAAKTPSRDVGLLWEGLLSGSQSELIGFATAEFTDSEVLVRNQSLLTHTGNLQYFNLWSFGGTVWGTSNYSVDL